MNTSQNPIRVFLIDDHKSFIDGLTMLININKSVMQVVGTAAGREAALAAIAAEKPDIILLDVDLGVENGIEMLPEIIRETGCKVIILTGTLDAEVHETAILRGARGVLLKTDSARVILKAVEKVYRGEIWVSNDTLNRVINQLTLSKGANGGAQTDDPEARKIETLTAREREIIGVLVNDESSTNKEIARRLFISDSTLKNHLTMIYAKLGLRNRIDLLKYALTHKLNKRN